MNREAILRAADWLDANPDKHLGEGQGLAADAAGNKVNPENPAAVSFCALGRVMFETDMPANLAKLPRRVACAIIEQKLDMTVREMDRIGEVSDAVLSSFSQPEGTHFVTAFMRKLAA